jgi:hypothetical protein
MDQQDQLACAQGWQAMEISKERNRRLGLLKKNAIGALKEEVTATWETLPFIKRST